MTYHIVDLTELWECWLARSYPLAYREYLAFLAINPHLDTDVKTWLDENWPEIAREFEDQLLSMC